MKDIDRQADFCKRKESLSSQIIENEEENKLATKKEENCCCETQKDNKCLACHHESALHTNHMSPKPDLTRN